MNKKSHKIRWRSVLFYAILVAWPIAQFCIFYIGVNASSIALAFQEFSDTGEFIKWGFGNFGEILFNSERALLPNQKTVIQGGLISLLSYVLSVVVCIPLGLLFSYYIGRKMPASGFFRVVLFLPSIIPEIVLVLLYRYFVIEAMPELFPSFGDWLGTNSSDVQKYTAIMFYTLILTGFGTSVLMYSNAMSKVSQDILEAGKLDGAKGFKEFWHLVLPNVFSTIAVFVVTGVSSIFVNQIHLYSFFQYPNYPPASISTYGYILYCKSTEIIDKTSLTIVNSKASILSAFGLMMTVVAIPLTFLVRWLLNRFGPSEK